MTEPTDPVFRANPEDVPTPIGEPDPYWPQTSATSTDAFGSMAHAFRPTVESPPPPYAATVPAIDDTVVTAEPPRKRRRVAVIVLAVVAFLLLVGLGAAGLVYQRTTRDAEATIDERLTTIATLEQELDKKRADDRRGYEELTVIRLRLDRAKAVVDQNEKCYEAIRAMLTEYKAKGRASQDGLNVCPVR